MEAVEQQRVQGMEQNDAMVVVFVVVGTIMVEQERYALVQLESWPQKDQ